MRHEKHSVIKNLADDGILLNKMLPLKKTYFLLAVIVSVLCFLIPGGKVFAHGGEDHGGDDHLQTSMISGAEGSGSPRITASSDAVELVGVFAQGKLTLFIDDAATNAPLEGLSIEVSADQNSAQAKAIASGEYEVALPWASQSGHYPLTFLLQGSDLTDLLQSTLDTVSATVSETTDKASTEHSDNASRLFGARGEQRLMLIGVGLVGLLLGGVLSQIRKRTQMQNNKTAQTDIKASLLIFALLSTSALITWPEKAQAHNGEDHGEAPAPVANAYAPQRLPDGRVFIPKSTQHVLGIRTLKANSENSQRMVTLNGRVMADPSASGVVQAAQAGRIEPAAEGFPVLGQGVKAGQVLAYLTPVLTSLERSNQQAALAELDAQTELAQRKRERLEGLAGSVPQKEIEAARLEAESLQQRRRVLATSLTHREALRAPVTGVISVADVVAGQVVSAGASLFTLVQPDRLWVEALSYDPSLLVGKGSETSAPDESTAVAQTGAITVRLSPVGRGPVLQDQSIPLLFRVLPPVPAIPVGQPVSVMVKSSTPVQGIPLPAEALTRNGQGQWVAWVHEMPELFQSYAVETEALDGQRMLVTHGLSAGMRVVTVGAASLSQIR